MVISRLIKSEKGQSAAEFALVLPLLITIICGIIDMGWVYSNQYQVDNAAYAGVRYAMINGADIEETEKSKLITDTIEQVENNLKESMQNPTVTVDIDSDDITVNVECEIRMFTFVGQMMFGEYYEANAENIGAR